MKQAVRQVEAAVAPKAESSVEIATDAKGMPKLTVKVYHEDAAVALQQAIALYMQGSGALQVRPATVPTA